MDAAFPHGRRKPPRKTADDRRLPSRNRRPPRQDADRRFRLAGDAAHRAARARGGRLLRDRAVSERGEGLRGDQAQGGDPVRRAVLRDGARIAARAAARFSIPACPSSPSAMASRSWPSNSAARSRPGITANSAAPKSKSVPKPAVRRRLGARPQISGVDEPRRPRDAPAGRLHSHRAIARTRRWPRSPTRRGAITACSFISKSCIRRTARSCSPISCTRSPGSNPTGPWRRSAGGDRRHSRQVGEGPRAVRTLGRRR